jgi:hypothetical protein
MRARVLRAMFLLFMGVMLAAYAASFANGKARESSPADAQVVWQDWC